MNKLKVGIDVDDVMLENNAFALRYLGLNNSVEEFTEWNAPIVQQIRHLYKDPEYVNQQPVVAGAKEFLASLLKIGCEVFFVTSVPAEVATTRIQALREKFPEVSEQNILICSRKDIVNVDILIDDAPHNILNSIAKWTILIRKPWNRGISGMLCANDLEEAFAMVQVIKGQQSLPSPKPRLVCLVGPSGSGKRDIICKLRADKYSTFSTPTVYTTANIKAPYYKNVSAEEMNILKETGMFIESTFYSGDEYCLGEIPEDDAVYIVAVDIYGFVKLKQKYNDAVISVFVTKPKAELVRNILEKDISNECKAMRLLSLDTEEKNAALCDYVVENHDVSETCDAIIRQVWGGYVI